MKQTFTLSAIVQNHFGVLTRVAGLFAKRCCNIYSLAVGETDDPEVSRMTIIGEGDASVKEQMFKQLLKLHDVKTAQILEHGESDLREHMLVKLSVNKGDNNAAAKTVKDFGGKVIDFSATTITAELAGSEEENSAFLDRAKKIGVIEMCRAGVIALAKGEKSIN